MTSPSTNRSRILPSLLTSSTRSIQLTWCSHRSSATKRTLPLLRCMTLSGPMLPTSLLWTAFWGSSSSIYTVRPCWRVSMRTSLRDIPRRSSLRSLSVVSSNWMRLRSQLTSSRERLNAYARDHKCSYIYRQLISFIYIHHKLLAFVFLKVNFNCSLLQN